MSPHTIPTLTLEDRKRLDWLYETIRQQATTFVGYPVNRLFDYRPLYRFLIIRSIMSAIRLSRALIA